MTDLLALAFALNSISHRVVETESFRRLLRELHAETPTRAAVRDSITQQEQKMRIRLIDRLSASKVPISIAADGWTNVRHEKVTNIVSLCDGSAFYWKSVVNACVACCMLSFVEPAPDLNRAAARTFMCSFGARYLHYYSISSAGRSLSALEDVLRFQLAQWAGQQGSFTDINRSVISMRNASAAAVPPAAFDPRLPWFELMNDHIELAYVAVALLSAPASEAAVERTFSAQDAVHTRKRNRMLSDIVQAEVFIKFNTRALYAGRQTSDGCVPLRGEDSDSDDDTQIDLNDLFARRKCAPASAAAAAASASAVDPVESESDPELPDGGAVAELLPPQRSAGAWVQEYMRHRGNQAWTREDAPQLEAAALQHGDSTVVLPATGQLVAMAKQALALSGRAN